MIIFIFNNNLSNDEEFKFKINRRQGFPNYQICSSHTQSSKCLESFQLTEKEDMNIFNYD